MMSALVPALHGFTLFYEPLHNFVFSCPQFTPETPQLLGIQGRQARELLEAHLMSVSCRPRRRACCFLFLRGRLSQILGHPCWEGLAIMGDLMPPQLGSSRAVVAQRHHRDHHDASPP